MTKKVILQFNYFQSKKKNQSIFLKFIVIQKFVR